MPKNANFCLHEHGKHFGNLLGFLKNVTKSIVVICSIVVSSPITRTLLVVIGKIWTVVCYIDIKTFKLIDLDTNVFQMSE